MNRNRDRTGRAFIPETNPRCAATLRNSSAPAPSGKTMSIVLSLPHIDISIEKGDWPNEAKLLALVGRAIGAAAKTAELAWPGDSELSLLFTDNEAMAEINGQWRNKPKPTNVLSFPGDDIEVGEPATQMIGDLVFAFETVIQEAEEQNKTFENHFSHLVVHGFLHLFGYDHIEDDEAELMESIETKALALLEIKDPYADLS